MHRRITPSLVEEASRAVQMIEVILIRLTPPETHICDLEIGPKMAGRVSVCLLVVIGSPLAVYEPRHRVLRVDIFWMLGNKLCRFWPQCKDRLGCIVEVDCETVCLVVIRHVSKNIVVDVAEEVDFRLHSPVVLHLC